MPESIPAPSRKRRRRWLLALLPMVLMGFALWWSTRPLPLPSFLQPFASRIHYQEHWRADIQAYRKVKRVDLYFVEQPLETVMLSMAGDVGAERLEFQRGGIQCYGPNRIGADWVSLRPGSFRGKSGTAVTLISKTQRVGYVDSKISSVLPVWSDIKFGKQILDQGFWRDFVSTRYDESSLRDFIRSSAR